MNTNTNTVVNTKYNDKDLCSNMAEWKIGNPNFLFPAPLMHFLCNLFIQISALGSNNAHIYVWELD